MELYDKLIAEAEELKNRAKETDLVFDYSDISFPSHCEKLSLYFRALRKERLAEWVRKNQQLKS